MTQDTNTRRPPKERLRILHGKLSAVDSVFQKQFPDVDAFIEKFADSEKLAKLYDKIAYKYPSFAKTYTKDDFMSKFRQDVAPKERSILVDPSLISSPAESTSGPASLRVQEDYVDNLPQTKETLKQDYEMAKQDYESYNGDSWVKKDKFLKLQNTAKDVSRVSDDFLRLHQGQLDWDKQLAIEESSLDSASKKLESLDTEIANTTDPQEIQKLQEQRDAMVNEFTKQRMAFEEKWSQPAVADVIKSHQALKRLKEEEKVLFADKYNKELEIKKLQKETDEEEQSGGGLGFLGGALTYLEDAHKRAGRSATALHILWADLLGDTKTAAYLRNNVLEGQEIGIAKNMAEISSKHKGGFVEQYVQLDNGVKAVVDNRGNVLSARDKNGYTIELQEDQIVQATKLAKDRTNIKTDSSWDRAAHSAIPSGLDMIQQIAMVWMTGGFGNITKLYNLAGANKVPSLVLNSSVSFYQSFGSEYASALADGYDSEKALQVAMGKSATVALLESVNPLEIELAKLGLKANFSRIREASLSELLAGKGMDGVYKKYVNSILKEAGTSGLKEKAEEILQGYFSNMVGNAISSNTEEYTMHDALNDGAPAFLLGSFGGAIKGSFQVKRNEDNLISSAMLNALEDPQDFLQKVDKLVEAGSVTVEQKQKAIEFLSKVDKELSKNDELKEEDKKALVGLVMEREAVMVDETRDEKANKRLDKVNKRIDALTKGKPTEAPSPKVKSDAPEEPKKEVKEDDVIDFELVTPEEKAKAKAEAEAKQDQVDEDFDSISKKPTTGEEEVLYESGNDRVVKIGDFTVVQVKSQKGFWVNAFAQDSERSFNTMNAYASYDPNAYINTPYYEAAEPVKEKGKYSKKNPNRVRKGERVNFANRSGSIVPGTVVSVNLDDKGEVDNFIVEDDTGGRHVLLSGNNIFVDTNPKVGDVYTTKDGREYQVHKLSNNTVVFKDTTTGEQRGLNLTDFASMVKSGVATRKVEPRITKEELAKRKAARKEAEKQTKVAKREKKEAPNKAKAPTDEVTQSLIDAPPLKVTKALIEAAAKYGVEVKPDSTVQEIVFGLSEALGYARDEDLVKVPKIEVEGETEVKVSEKTTRQEINKRAAAAEKTIVDDRVTANSVLNEVITATDPDELLSQLDDFKEEVSQSTRDDKEKSFLYLAIDAAAKKATQLKALKKAQEEKEAAKAAKREAAVPTKSKVVGTDLEAKKAPKIEQTPGTPTPKFAVPKPKGKYEVLVYNYNKEQTEKGKESLVDIENGKAVSYRKQGGIWYNTAGKDKVVAENQESIQQQFDDKIASSVVLDGGRYIKSNGKWTYFYDELKKPITDSFLIKTLEGRAKVNLSQNASVVPSARRALKAIVNRTKLEQQVTNIKNALSKLVPNLTISVLSNEEYIEVLGQSAALDTNGKYFPDSNTIYINADTATASTIFHEATHAAVIALFGIKGEGSKVVTQMHHALMSVLQQGNEVEKALAARLEDVIAGYQENDVFIDDIKAQEYLAELGGILSSTKLAISKPTTLEKIVKLINEVLANIIGISPLKDNSSVNEFVDFINDLSYSLRSGIPFDKTPAGEVMVESGASLNSIIGVVGGSALSLNNYASGVMANYEQANAMRKALMSNLNNPPVITEAPKVSRVFDEETGALVKENVYTNFFIDFADGATSRVVVYDSDRSVAQIGRIDASKVDSNPEIKVRGTNTYTRVLGEIVKMGMSTVHIPLQSTDSVMALRSLVNEGILTMPRGNIGGDTPTIFDIDKRLLQAKLDSLPKTEDQVARTIKRATGWELGADGKWRYEIPDNWTIPNPLNVDSKKGIFLKDYISGDSDLFKAYPQLKYLRLYSADMGSMKNVAHYNSEEKNIYINKKFLEKGTLTPANAKDIILHEVQHAIQDIEGFSLGSSPENMANMLALKNNYSFESYANAKNKSVEALRAFANRYPEVAANVALGNNLESTSALVSLPITSTKSISNILNTDILPILGEGDYDIYTALIALISAEEEAMSYQEAGYDNYYNLLGEAEARNAVFRSHLEESTKRNLLLKETDGVAEESLILLEQYIKEAGVTMNQVSLMASEERPTAVEYRQEDLFSIFGYTIGQDLINLSNRIKTNIAKRMGLSLEQYNERLSWAFIKELPHSINDIVNSVAGIMGRNNNTGVLLQEVDFEDVSSWDEVERIIGNRVDGIDYTMRHLPMLYASYNPLRTFIDSKTKQGQDERINQNINRVQSELASLAKQGLKDSEQWVELQEELDTYKSVKTSLVTKPTYEDIANFIDESLKSLRKEIEETDIFYANDVPDSLIDSRIEQYSNPNTYNPEQLAIWTSIRDNDNVRHEFIRTNVEVQRNDLLQISNYLNQSMYPREFQLALLNDIIKKYYYKNDAGNWEVIPRTRSTLASFNNLRPDVLGSMVVGTFNYVSKNVFTLYLNEKTIIDEENGGGINLADYAPLKVQNTSKGFWVKFDKGNNDHAILLHKLASTTLDNAAWCTSSASTAQAQLANGDFYIHVDFEGKANLAIRYEGDRIGEEPRGTLPGQAVSPEYYDILGDFLENKAPNGKDYLDTVKQNRLVGTYLKNQDAFFKNLSKEDYIWLYINLKSRGYSEDPNVQYLKERLSTDKYVIAIIFGTSVQNIATTLSDITSDTVVFLGDIKELYKPINAPRLEIILGDLSIRTTIFAPKVTYITGSVIADKNVNLSFPQVTTIGGNVIAYKNATLSLPQVTTIGGNVITRENATLSFPQVTTIGGDVNVGEKATLSLPQATTIGRNVIAYKNANLSLPQATTIGGNVIADENATLSFPQVTTIGGDVIAYKNATLSLPQVTTIGGNVNAYGNSNVLLNISFADKVAGGNVTFVDKQEGHAAIIKTNTSSTILLTFDSDITSPMHELAHEFERVLTEDERTKVLRWANKSKWDKSVSEKFAKGFEKFLYEGISPVAQLTEVFKRFRNWILTYLDPKNIQVLEAIELNDDMRRLYAALVVSKENDTLEDNTLPPTRNTTQPIQQEPNRFDTIPVTKNVESVLSQSNNIALEVLRSVDPEINNKIENETELKDNKKPCK